MIESTKFFNSQSYSSKTNTMEYKSDFIDLVRHVEAKARDNGMTLSRWQTNGRRGVSITYAIHKGDRPAQFRYIHHHDLVAYFFTDCLEGKTSRCKAYKSLKDMAEEI